MKHLWQLPGLFVKNKQGRKSLQHHLEKIGVKANLKPFKALKHQITHHQIQLQSFIANISKKKLFNQRQRRGEGEAPAALPMEGATRAPIIDKYEWHSLKNLKQLAIPAADRKILENLL